MGKEIIVWAVAIAPIAILVTYILRKVRFTPYRSQERLITPTESKFFSSLTKALEPRFRVNCCVRVADVLETKGKFVKNKNAFHAISSKHVDFVVTCPSSARIYAAIELDDKSHERRDRRRRDKFLNKAFEGAGMPLVRYEPSDSYDFSNLIQILNQSKVA